MGDSDLVLIQNGLKRGINRLNAEIYATRSPPPTVRRWRVAYAPPARIPAKSNLLPRSGKWTLNNVEGVDSYFKAQYYSHHCGLFQYATPLRMLQTSTQCPKCNGVGKWQDTPNRGQCRNCGW